ncbi:hypothetical protein PtB15_6B879 [Puccinia triticina]|nr:hypothetical protein PtB15_6B879 [Puccinia triticina]
MSAAPSNRGTKVGAKLASPNPQVQPNFVDYETLLLPPLGRASPAILDHPDHPGHPPSRAHSCQTKDRGSSFILSGPTLAVVIKQIGPKTSSRLDEDLSLLQVTRSICCNILVDCPFWLRSSSQLREARLGTMGGGSGGCLLADSLRFSAIRGERVTARSTQFGLLLAWQSLLGEWSG